MPKSCSWEQLLWNLSIRKSLLIMEKQLIYPTTVNLQEILSNIKSHWFQNSISHQEHLYYKTFTTGCFQKKICRNFCRNNLFYIKVFKISRKFIGKFQDSNSKQILLINSLALLKILGKLDCYLPLIKLWLMYWKI